MNLNFRRSVTVSAGISRVLFEGALEWIVER